MFVYVGAVTSGNMAGEWAEGITVLHLDTSSGAMTPIQTLAGLHNPTFLAVHPRLPVLYAGERYTTVYGPAETLSGSITSFSIDADGRLAVLDRQPSGGPAYVSMHPSGQFLFAAIPRSYCVMAYPLGDDGRAAPATGIVQHHGHGVNLSTWQAPYPHSVYPDKLGRRALACDMGLDRIMLHDFDVETGRLAPSSPHAYTQLSSGAGPRHLAVHPSGQTVYTVNELSSTVSAFSYEPETACMRILATLSTIPEDFRARNSGAQIVVHPSGNFAYSSNRGHNSIASFALDPDTGRPRLIGWEPSQGETPRNFNIDPSGRCMLVANQKSGNIVSFHIDQSSGALSPTGHSLTSPSPVCIMFGGDA